MRVFVLGAADPEMREIASVLKAAKERYVYACKGEDRIHPGTAYQAENLSHRVSRRARLIFVECAVKGYPRIDVVDHHNIGDPGYACGPSDYLLGSSLGQVLAILGQTPTELQRIICAADHCPTAAYQGLCPGVPVEAFANWRCASKAEFKGVSFEEIKSRLDAQYELLKVADRINIAGTDVLWMPVSSDELPDASARYGMPVMYRMVDRDGRNKAGILNAPAHVIEAWMKDCDLTDVYGNPNRGYAGGYF